MEFATVLEGFAGRLGLGAVEADGDGVYRLVFDDALEAEFVPRGTTHVRVQGAVGDDPTEMPGAEQALEELLRVNLARLRRRGEVLSFDQGSRKLVLSRLVALDGLNAELFCVVIEEFLDSLSLCRAAFSNALGGPPVVSFGTAFRPFG
jgi:hypothetical protein